MSCELVRTLSYIVSLAVVTVTLNSCSSSTSDQGLLLDDGANTGTTTNGGGIGGSGFVDLAVGDITGFSSVIINGIAYDTSVAAITVNGKPATQADLRIGMNVVAAVNLQAQAAGSISYTPIVLGPVTTVSYEARTFEILGQTVVVNSNTVLVDVSLNANASEVIAEGAIIEVSGIRNPDNDIVASFIRRADSATKYQILGSVEAGVDADQALLIDGLLVDVSGIDPGQFSEGVSEGDDISLFLSPDSDEAVALADSSILPVPTANDFLTLNGGTQVRLEGYFESYDALGGGYFLFDGLDVFLTEDTIFSFIDGSPATANDLRANSRIELIATFTGDGAVAADKIIIIDFDRLGAGGIDSGTTGDNAGANTAAGSAGVSVGETAGTTTGAAAGTATSSDVGIADNNADANSTIGAADGITAGNAASTAADGGDEVGIAGGNSDFGAADGITAGNAAGTAADGGDGFDITGGNSDVGAVGGTTAEAGNTAGVTTNGGVDIGDTGGNTGGDALVGTADGSTAGAIGVGTATGNGSDGTSFQIAGIISNHTPGVTFTVGDLQVFVDENTIYSFVDGSPASANELRDGSRVDLFAISVGDGMVSAIEVIIIVR